MIRWSIIALGATAAVYTMGLIWRLWTLGDWPPEVAFIAGWGACALSHAGLSRLNQAAPSKAPGAPRGG